MEWVESESVELKQEINADFKKEIVAFANTNGGDIFIGITRDGNVIGVENPEFQMERITSMISDGIRPDLVPFTSVKLLQENGRVIIRVSVLKGTNQPYYLAEKGPRPQGVFIRHGVASIPATIESIRQMIRDADQMTFDQSRSLNQELTFHYAKEYFKKKNLPFSKANQRTLGLIDVNGFWTQTALLLSDQCEHTIRCAIFLGKSKTNFKDRIEFSGSVLKQMEETYRYICQYNALGSRFKGLDRIDQLAYPEFAIREALINAIIHRDYSFSGSIIINIFLDRIEFVSLGGLVKGLTLRDVMNGVSELRNKTLANIFYRLRLVESYGTGFARMLEEYPTTIKPQFLVGDASFVTILPNRNEKEEHHLEMKSVVLQKTTDDPVLDLFKNQKAITRKDVESVLKSSSFPARQKINQLLKENKIKVQGQGPSTTYVLVDANNEA